MKEMPLDTSLEESLATEVPDNLIPQKVQFPAGVPHANRCIDHLKVLSMCINDPPTPEAPKKRMSPSKPAVATRSASQAGSASSSRKTLEKLLKDAQKNQTELARADAETSKKSVPKSRLPKAQLPTATTLKPGQVPKNDDSIDDQNDRQKPSRGIPRPVRTSKTQLAPSNKETKRRTVTTKIYDPREYMEDAPSQLDYNNSEHEDAGDQDFPVKLSRSASVSEFEAAQAAVLRPNSSGTLVTQSHTELPSEKLDDRLDSLDEAISNLLKDQKDQPTKQVNDFTSPIENAYFYHLMMRSTQENSFEGLPEADESVELVYNEEKDCYWDPAGQKFYEIDQ